MEKAVVIAILGIMSIIFLLFFHIERLQDKIFNLEKRVDELEKDGKELK